MKKVIVYDFDGTLSRGVCQDYGLTAYLGYSSPEDFWNTSIKWRRSHNIANTSTSYLTFILHEAQKKNLPLTKDTLFNLGCRVPLFPGLSFFLPALSKTYDQYILSSGIADIIEGCLYYNGLSTFFKGIIANTFIFGNEGAALFPATAINSRGKLPLFSSLPKNWKDTIYVGDGPTDQECITLAKEKGGNAAYVFDPEPPTNPSPNLPTAFATAPTFPAEFSEKSAIYKWILSLENLPKGNLHGKNP